MFCGVPKKTIKHNYPGIMQLENENSSFAGAMIVNWFYNSSKRRIAVKKGKVSQVVVEFYNVLVRKSRKMLLVEAYTVKGVFSRGL